jgi:hypothetical protein
MRGGSIADINASFRIDTSKVGQDCDKALKEVRKAGQQMAKDFNLKKDTFRINSGLGAFGIGGISKGFAKQFGASGKGLLGEEGFGAAGNLIAGAASFLGPVGLAAAMVYGAGKLSYNMASKPTQDEFSASWKDFKGNFKIGGQEVLDLPWKGATLGMDRLTAMKRWTDEEGKDMAISDRFAKKLSYFLGSGDQDIEKFNPANTRGMFTPHNWKETDIGGYEDSLTMAALDMLKDQDDEGDDKLKKHREEQKDSDRKKEANNRALRGL